MTHPQKEMTLDARSLGDSQEHGCGCCPQSTRVWREPQRRFRRLISAHSTRASRGGGRHRHAYLHSITGLGTATRLMLRPSWRARSSLSVACAKKEKEVIDVIRHAICHIVGARHRHSRLGLQTVSRIYGGL